MNLPRHKEPVFLGIQALRGIAAAMVVLFHASANWSAIAGSPCHPWWSGRAGIDIFFVISGFVMATTAIGKGQGPAAAMKFMKRRVLRFVPLYWLVTSLLLLKIDLIGSVHANGPSGQVPWLYVVCSYLLIPCFNGLGTTHPLLETGWTLSFELFFYLCFACALWLRKSVTPFLFILLSIIVFAGFFHKPSWPAVTELCSPLLLEFLAGVAIGRSVQTRTTLAPALSATLGCAGLLILAAASSFAPTPPIRLGSGIAAVFIVNAAIVLEVSLSKHIPRWLLLVGDSSYSLYLTHLPLLGLYVFLLRRAHVFVPGRVRYLDAAIGILFCLVASAGAGILIYRWVERPMTEWARRRAHLATPLQVESTPT